MHKLLLLSLITFFYITNGTVTAKAQEHLWSRMVTDLHDSSNPPPPAPSVEDSKNSCVTVDPSGNIVVFGKFVGTMDFGGGPLTSSDGAFLAKLDPSGAHLWSQKFDADFYGPYDTEITADALGNVIVTATVADSVDFGSGWIHGWTVLAKFDSTGSSLWSRAFQTNGNGSSYVASRGVATDAGGNILLVGGFTGTVDFGSGPLTSAGGTDMYVAKFDPDGTTLWSHRYGANFTDFAGSVACDTQGNILVGGHAGTSPVDLGGGPQSVPTQSSMLTLAKYDASGSHLWSQVFANHVIYGKPVPLITTDATDNVVATTSFEDSIDLGGGFLYGENGVGDFLAKWDPSGAHIWSQSFTADPGGFGLADLDCDAAGNIHATGAFVGTLDLGGGPLSTPTYVSLLAATFDPQGTHLWSRCFGEWDGINLPTANGIAIDSNGDATMVFEWDGGIDFGGGLFETPHDLDFFVVKFGEIPTDVFDNGTGISVTLRAFPNPTRGAMVLTSRAMLRPIALRIVDTRGRLVRALEPQGSNRDVDSYVWDGRGARGELVPAGVYFAVVRRGQVTATRKLLIVR